MSLESANKRVEVPRNTFSALVGLNALSLIGTAVMAGLSYHEYTKGHSVDGRVVASVAPAAEMPMANKKPVAEGEFLTEQFTVTLADSHASHFAKIHVIIEPDAPIAGAELERLRPRMRDFINALLSSKRLEEIDNAHGKEMLRNEIQRGLERHLERDRVKNVYFSHFVLQ